MNNKPYSTQDILNAVFDSASGNLRIINVGGGGGGSGIEDENSLKKNEPFSTTLQLNDSTYVRMTYTNGGFTVNFTSLGGEEVYYQKALDYSFSVTPDGGVTLSAGNEIDSVDAHVSVSMDGVELLYRPDGSTEPVSVVLGSSNISIDGGGATPNVAIKDGAITIKDTDSTIANFSNDNITLRRYVDGEAGGVSEHTIGITSGGITLAASVVNGEGEFSRAVTLNSRGLSMTGPDIPTVEIGSGGILVGGESLATQAQVSSSVSTLSGSIIVIKPFSFTLDQMTDEGNDELSIDVPGFVFKVMNEATGVVLCDTVHNDDGSSTIVFSDIDTGDSGEGGNDSFIAYSFVNSDGSVIPMLSKTNL